MRYTRSASILLAVLAAALAADPQPVETAAAPSRRVILITLDGVRTEEMFGGLDEAILRAVTTEGRAEDTEAWRRYWAPTAEARRERLMPFFWRTLMRDHGSIAGNRAAGSTARVANRHRFSYPGYAEILTGVAHDAEIASNDNVRNPFMTVLEFARAGLGLPRTGVATFGSWETFRWIAEHEEGATTVNAGMQAYDLVKDPAIEALSQFQFLTRPPWGGARFDAYTLRFARAHLERFRPRLLYIALDDTDDWAHSGRYDRVLDALAAFDESLRDLWTWLEQDPEYRGHTLLVITTDHGRGATPSDWRSHGQDVQGAELVWAAFAGTTGPRGEWRGAKTIHQTQLAATIAGALGLDYRSAVPEAGEPIDLGLGPVR